MDINCDMGEGCENDAQIFPYISSCNISCGAHAGSNDLIRKTVESAISHGLCIGAHPSYPDKTNFGRKAMPMNSEDLQASLMDQVGKLNEIVKEFNVNLSYVKPHGALYHELLHDNSKAEIFLNAIKGINKDCAVMSMSGGVLQRIARAQSTEFIAEAFADRRYLTVRELVNRINPDALITDPDIAARQAVDIATHTGVLSAKGEKLNIQANSLCIHGDNPAVISVLKAIRREFGRHGIIVQSSMK